MDGHDLPGLITLLRNARDLKVPVVVHVITRKGCGYIPAEEDPSRFHGIGKFEPLSGQSIGGGKPSFSDGFGKAMLELAREDSRICAITAAMPGGTGLLEFKKKYPKRLFDVGIAEEHAVSMAGGLAKQGMIPVVAIYSTFLQRAFDQIMQDVALLNLHVVFAVDRCGLVGEDGATHHGVFDVGYLRQIPGMTLLAPASIAEQQQMLRWAVQECTGPVAVRYPRGGDGEYTAACWDPCAPVVGHCHGRDVAILTYGTLLNNCLDAAQQLEGDGIHVGVYQLTRLNPLPDAALEAALSEYSHVLVVEEACAASGISAAVANCLTACQIHEINLGNDFVPHGAVKTLYEEYKLDAKSIADRAREVLKL